MGVQSGGTGPQRRYQYVNMARSVSIHVERRLNVVYQGNKLYSGIITEH